MRFALENPNQAVVEAEVVRGEMLHDSGLKARAREHCERRAGMGAGAPAVVLSGCGVMIEATLN